MKRETRKSRSKSAVKKEKTPKKAIEKKSASKVVRASRSKSVTASKKDKAEKKSKSKPATKTPVKEERAGRARKTDKGKSAAAAQETNQDKAIFNAFMTKPDQKPASPVKPGLGFAMPIMLDGMFFAD